MKRIMLLIAIVIVGLALVDISAQRLPSRSKSNNSTNELKQGDYYGKIKDVYGVPDAKIITISQVSNASSGSYIVLSYNGSLVVLSKFNH